MFEAVLRSLRRFEVEQKAQLVSAKSAMADSEDEGATLKAIVSPTKRLTVPVQPGDRSRPFMSPNRWV